MKFTNKTNYKSLHLLNITQFLGALNDNIFKLIVAYLLINLKGQSEASSILAIAGIVFVVPFLLFSNAAGVLADKLSKRNITVGTKVAEVLIMTLGVISISLKWEFGSYFLLFLMAMQSAVFGPSKFGIIPELVQEKYVSKANGLLGSFTYLAIIFGAFLASFITHITNQNFIIAALFCLLISIIGLITSFGIIKTPAKRSKKKINPFFLYEIFKTLKRSSYRRHLFSSILGSAYFLFLGGYVQLNIIPFAIQSLNLSALGGGFLFSTTAIGIAIGAIIAGKISKGKVEPAISCISGFCLSIMLFLLFVFAKFLIAVVIILIVLGIFGGLMLIPFDSFIQIASPDKERGQVIAASNFLSFTGVLLSAFTLYLLGEKFQISAASGFAIISIITFLFILFLTGRLSSLFFPYFIDKIYSRFRPIHLKSPMPENDSVIVTIDNSWKTVLTLFAFFNKIKIFIPGKTFSRFPFLSSFFSSFLMVKPKDTKVATLARMFQKAKKYHDKGYLICLMLDKSYSNESIMQEYEKQFKEINSKLFQVKAEKEEISVSQFQKLMHLKRIDITFQKQR
jgi:acyl-[acyl-carrier-protein]-phospholipid O-acyltransferase / long-chain-fatty-acid--[acyl-carrier-protein] ligase